MSGNNRSFCDSYTRKHFNIKHVLRALCIVHEIRQAVPVTATAWTAFGYDSGNVILFSLCVFLALAHLPSPALFAQHLLCLDPGGICSFLVGERLPLLSFPLKHSITVKLNIQMSEPFPASWARKAPFS